MVISLNRRGQHQIRDFKDQYSESDDLTTRVLQLALLTAWVVMVAAIKQFCKNKQKS